MYSLVTMNALLVGLLGLSALAVARTERRQSLTSSDQMIARENAASAVAAAVARIKADSAWRTTFSNNTESATINFTTGTATWKLVDTVDSILNNNSRHSVLVQGIGKCGSATWVESVESYQPEMPLPSLAMAVHTKGKLRIDSGMSLTAAGAAASTDDELRIDGFLVGNGVCNSRTGSGTSTGTVTTGAAAKEAPTSSTLVTTYKNLATTLSYNGSLSKDTLGPATNTYGGSTNSDGVYYINSGSNTLTIQNTRVFGTLIVKGNVTINNGSFLQFNRHDYPVLIVDGNLTINVDSTDFLSEWSNFKNFNPSNVPFQGNTDSDFSDVYPCEIWGFVHVTGTTTFTSTSRIVGMLLSDGDVRCSASAVIQSDPSIFFAPPANYWTATPGPLQFKPTQWKRASL